MALVNRLLSLLLGLVLIATGLAVLAWIVATVVGRRQLPGTLPRNYDQVVVIVQQAGALYLRQPAVLAGSVLALLLGVVLLVLELKPPPPRQLTLLREEHWNWVVDRRSCEYLLRSVIEDRTPIQRSTVRLRRSWRLIVEAEGDDDIRPELESHISGALERLGAPADGRVTYRMRRTRGVT